jgi:hypothetical protein
LFATIPGQRLCRMCRPVPLLPRRCQAAHPEDPSPCEGPRNAVRVVDQVGEQRYGCVHHAAVALGCIQGVRVWPESVAYAAIEAHNRASAGPVGFDPVRPWPVPVTDRAAGWGGR